MATATEPISIPITPPAEKADALYEFVDGEWKETPRMGLLAGTVASALVYLLNTFAIPNRRGLAVSEVLFRLAPKGPARRPDVAFVPYENWPYSTPPDEDPAAFEGAPALAIEVNSPTNSADDIIDKSHDYFFHGVQLVWVVYPRQRIVHVHESPEHIRVLSEKNELEGGVVLPGFRLPLSQLFGLSVKPA